MPSDENKPTSPADEPLPRYWGAFLASAGLVLLPGLALYLAFDQLDEHGSTGLPILALFGIVVLVGALALTSTSFRSLGLAQRSQPLALPPGSVRATITLSLIVLFAIIAISVLRPSGKTQHLQGLTLEAKNEMVRDGKVQILSEVTEECATKTAPAAALVAVPASAPASRNARNIIARAAPPAPVALVPVAPAAGAIKAATCAPADQRFTLMVQPGLGPVSLDLAKQLLSLIGQLMTMAVSFYFAARTAGRPPEPKATPSPEPRADQRTDPNANPNPNPNPNLPETPAAKDVAGQEDHTDGCNVAITNPTPDHELPVARGGVVPK